MTRYRWTMIQLRSRADLLLDVAIVAVVAAIGWVLG
jgi:hypothetical protein